MSRILYIVCVLSISLLRCNATTELPDSLDSLDSLDSQPGLNNIRKSSDSISIRPMKRAKSYDSYDSEEFNNAEENSEFNSFSSSIELSSPPSGYSSEEDQNDIMSLSEATQEAPDYFKNFSTSPSASLENIATLSISFIGRILNYNTSPIIKRDKISDFVKARITDYTVLYENQKHDFINKSDDELEDIAKQLTKTIFIDTNHKYKAEELILMYRTLMGALLFKSNKEKILHDGFTNLYKKGEPHHSGKKLLKNFRCLGKSLCRLNLLCVRQENRVNIEKMKQIQVDTDAAEMAEIHLMSLFTLSGH